MADLNAQVGDANENGEIVMTALGLGTMKQW